jgi:hypothetical protein
MKRTIGPLMFGLVCVPTIFGDDKPVAEPPSTWIVFDARQPVGEQAVIKGKGGYSVKNGFGIIAVVMRASPVRGGVLSTTNAQYKDGKWSAETRIAPGTYNVIIMLTVKNAKTGEEMTFGSAYAFNVHVR